MSGSKADVCDMTKVSQSITEGFSHLMLIIFLSLIQRAAPCMIPKIWARASIWDTDDIMSHWPCRGGSEPNGPPKSWSEAVEGPVATGRCHGTSHS